MGPTLVVEQPVAATPDQVFTAWTSGLELARWWWPHIPDTSYEVDARPGGRYDIRSEAAGIGVEGEFISLVPPTEIVMTWRFLTDGVSEVEETVRVLVEPDGDRSLVTVRHQLDDIVDDDTNPRLGWESVLGRLAELHA